MRQSYHFDIGNTSDRPIGLFDRVEAEDEEGAVAILKAILDKNSDQSGGIDIPCDGNIGGEYVRLYLNPEHITTKQIDSIDEIQ